MTIIKEAEDWIKENIPKKHQELELEILHRPRKKWRLLIIKNIPHLGKQSL